MSNQYDPWKVGEVTKLIKADHFVEYIGTEVEITAGLTMRGAIDTGTMSSIHRMSYKVRCHDGLILSVRPDQVEPRAYNPDKVLELEKMQ